MTQSDAYLKAYSPRVWGCFYQEKNEVDRHFVFPTRVGVFLKSELYYDAANCIPHACGGVS